MVRKTMEVKKEHLQEGKGTITIRHILSDSELMGHGKMYAHVILPPHSSIGVHTHTGNTEPYYILKGEGIFTDNDGSRTAVHAGDVCVIECGQSHGMENLGQEDFEMMALILNEA